MPSYTLVQIPTSLDVTREIMASDMTEVREWALNNIDTTTRWIIKLDGKNIGEAIIVELWRVMGRGGKATKQIFNYIKPMSSWFNSKKEAEDDYNRHKEAVALRLDEIEQKIAELQKALKFEIECHIDGDTHGIHEEYQYINVTECGYEYYRKT
jgi:hypothetical protein